MHFFLMSPVKVLSDSSLYREPIVTRNFILYIDQQFYIKDAHLGFSTEDWFWVFFWKIAKNQQPVRLPTALDQTIRMCVCVCWVG